MFVLFIVIEIKMFVPSKYLNIYILTTCSNIYDFILLY